MTIGQDPADKMAQEAWQAVETRIQRGFAPAYKAGPDAWETATSLAGNASKAKATAQLAEQKVKQLLADDTKTDAHRSRLIEETINEAKQQLSELRETTAALVPVLEAVMVQAANPELPQGDELHLAVEEFRMRIAPAGNDGSKVSGEIRRMAHGPDRRLAALAVGTPGRTALEAAGRSSQEHAGIARLTAYEGRHATTDTAAAASEALNSGAVTRLRNGDLTSGATEAALTFAESTVRRLVDSLDPRNVA